MNPKKCQFYFSLCYQFLYDIHFLVVITQVSQNMYCIFDFAIGSEDKKTNGGVLIAGSILWVPFTYLKRMEISKFNRTDSCQHVAVTYIFIFFAIYYDLFEKSEVNYHRI